MYTPRASRKSNIIVKFTFPFLHCKQDGSEPRSADRDPPVHLFFSASHQEKLVLGKLDSIFWNLCSFHCFQWRTSFWSYSLLCSSRSQLQQSGTWVSLILHLCTSVPTFTPRLVDALALPGKSGNPSKYAGGMNTTLWDEVRQEQTMRCGNACTCELEVAAHTHWCTTSE